MDNLSRIEFLKSNYVSTLCNSQNKLKKAESVMITCVDNQSKSLRPHVIINRYITPELSLNRLFDVAKEEHQKKHQKK